MLEKGGLLFEWSTIITSVGSVLLAATVFFASVKKTSNYYFALMAATLGLISLANYFSLTSDGSEYWTLFWIRAVMALVPFVMIFLYGFGISYENQNYRFSALRGGAIGFLCLVTAIISVLPITYESVSFAPDGAIVPATGPGLMLVGLFFMPVFLAAIIAMFRNARIAEPIQKRKINIALYLFLVAFGTQIITSFVLVAALNYTKLVPIGNLLSFLYIAAMTASILRYRLITINIVSSSVFVVVLSVMLFADIFSAKDSQETVYRVVVFAVTAFIEYQFLRAIVLDARRKKQLEYYSTELEKANTRLKQVDAMKTEFISMASHELLTPISAIEGYLSMIIDEHMVKIEDPKASKYLTNIYLSSRRLARLVSDLLNVSRIEQGRLLLQKADTDVSELIASTLAELKFKAEEAKLSLTSSTEISKDELKTYIDADKIKEVIVNLCGNSLKFTPAGGKVIVGVTTWPTEKVSASFAHMEGHFKRDHKATSEGALQSAVNHKLKQLIGERQLVVSVTDTGIGIAQEDLGKLFQKFSRLEDVMAHSIPGTGLGLYISRALVELNHGRIWAESEGRGKGATFRFTLPLAAATPEIKKLDAAVPQAKDAKPLSRMGGDPGLNGASDGMLKPQPKSVVSEQVTSDPTSFRPVGTSLGRPNSADPPADEEGTSLGRQAVRAETREGNDISKTGGDKLELDKQEDSSDDVSENDKPKLPVSMAAKLEAAKARHRDNGRLPSAEGKNGNSGPGKVSKEDEEVPKNE